MLSIDGIDSLLFVGAGTLFLSYAEIHYKIKGVYSRLWQKAPEVIVDMPHRLEPETELPVVLLIKDSDPFPIEATRVEVKIRQNDQIKTSIFEINSGLITKPLWFQTIYVATQDFKPGRLEVSADIFCVLDGKKVVFRNDNYKHSSGKPFVVHLAKEKLPKTTGWLYGDLHYHSNYTNDQVEFGAPLAATRKVARAIGLNFFCATDHSYDLDDLHDNYLQKDPELSKWTSLWDEIENLNSETNDFIIVPGEEVSVGNKENKNVHFLALNNPEFLPGEGDGAEKWLRNKPTRSIANTLQNCNSNSVSFAAHPTTQPSFLEKLLVRRGSWKYEDFLHDGLHGLQIWNGCKSGLDDTVHVWKRLLLAGRRTLIIGGNDAHGNFNRYRQISFPFWTMREHHDHLFGKVKTAVLLNEPLTVDNLMRAVKRGAMIVTDGPFMTLKIENQTGAVAQIGETISGDQFKVHLDCKSTDDFGQLHKTVLFYGDLKSQKESIVESVLIDNGHAFRKTFAFKATGSQGYFRAETTSIQAEQEFRCFTNPVWVK